MKLYPKIDIYINGTYYASTNWHKTCKSAAESVAKKNPVIDPKTIKARKVAKGCNLT